MIDTPLLEDHHRELAAQVDHFNREQVREGLRSRGEDEQARGLVRALASEGLLDYAVPARFDAGAKEIDVRALCVVRERLSYESSLADLMFAMQGLGSYPVTLAGAGEIKRRLLPQVKSGEAIAAFAITEPEAGSDVSAIQTAARRDGASYVIDGRKTFISNAGLADFYTVFAKTDPAKGHKGITAFVVERDTPGFSFEEKIELIAPHPIGRIGFNDCRVPAANRLGEEGEGFKIAMATLDTFRPTVGAAATGLAWRAMDEAVGYAGRRIQFGKPISEFQSTQMKIAEMATELDAARLLVYRAAWKKDSGQDRVTLESAMAKLFATEAAQRIIDAAVQIHGGAGLVKGAAVERLYREIRALRIYEGTSEIQKLVIAGRLLR
ncbi:MAG TPA: acyl-CoA dehydrogenase family protein [Blastocatellia bacterium]|jgi:acyl-CoA dehydrogenase|nr:acyl-CoA dehydrogenase family protein [Blastocatellia bacterium]